MLTRNLLLCCIGLLATAQADESVPPLSSDERSVLAKSFEQTLEKFPAPATDAPDAVNIHSRRGDALFFLGRFAESVAEYQAMVTRDPSVDTSHWRLGIALFFADKPAEAAAQFEKYHAFDNVDRENGIWRYLSQYKAGGAEKARQELIRYEKDDREPFPAVYRLFDGSLTAQQALDNIPADLEPSERDKRLFYTELYIGLHLVAQKKPAEAVEFLSRSVSRQWPRTAGYGPNYMWHVGRVQLDLLKKP